MSSRKKQKPTDEEPHWNISVRLVPYEQLREASLLHHESLRRRRRYTDLCDDEAHASARIRHRWIVNYVRHALTDYDSLRRGLPDQQVKELKKTVLDEIAVTYPQLKRECINQKQLLDEESA